MTPDEFGGFDLEDVRKKAEAARNKKPEEKKTAPAKPKKEPKSVKVPQAPAVHIKSKFNISEIETKWIIEGIGWSEQFKYAFMKSPLDNGALHNYNYWFNPSSLPINIAPMYPIHAVSMPLHYDLFRALYKNADGNFRNKIEEIRQFVSKELKDNWVSTLTRIDYSPKPQEDSINHTYTVSGHEKQQNRDIEGIDCLIDGTCGISALRACEALLGTPNTKEINAVFKWLTGCEPRLQTYPAKPGQPVSSYLIMHTEKDKLRILAMAKLEQDGKAFGFERIYNDT